MTVDSQSRRCAHCNTALPADAWKCPQCKTPVARTLPSGPWGADAGPGDDEDFATQAAISALPQTEGPADLDVGEVLSNQWKLEEKIGEGGMGRVFRATELKLGRRVAVKALRRDNLDDDTVRRFEREAQMMGKLDHPGVVTLYGVGRERGIPFLVMKYLDGRSLWGFLDEHHGTLTPALLWPVADQLLTALGYIHQEGLLHRDLKPSNIHVGSSGRVTLLDLGLARGQVSTLTRTGVVWGTPDFMAPEQIVGDKHLDGRADLYAIGVVLYRMLVNQPPFPDSDEQALMRAHLTRPRPDASRVVPRVSVALGAALQKAMAIKPEDRFQSADEMRAALERVMSPSAASREPATVARKAVEDEVSTQKPPEAPRPARTRSNPGLPTEAAAPAVQRPPKGSAPRASREAQGAATVLAHQAAPSLLNEPSADPTTPLRPPLKAIAPPNREQPTAPSRPTQAPTDTVPVLPNVRSTLAPPTHGEADGAAKGLVPLWQRPAVLIAGAVLLVLAGMALGALIKG